MPKDFKRTDRIADLIQRELAIILQREMQDPRLGMVTISAVKVSRDILHAKIFVTFLESEKIKEGLVLLNNAAPYLRSLLAKRLDLRTTPQLLFVYDETIAYGNRLSNLIDQAIKSDQKNN